MLKRYVSRITGQEYAYVNRSMEEVIENLKGDPTPSEKVQLLKLALTDGNNTCAARMPFLDSVNIPKHKNFRWDFMDEALERSLVYGDSITAWMQVQGAWAQAHWEQRCLPYFEALELHREEAQSDLNREESAAYDRHRYFKYGEERRVI